MAKAMRDAGVLRFQDGQVAVELHPSVFAAPVAEVPEAPDPRPQSPLAEWESLTPEQQALWASSPEDAEVAAAEQGLTPGKDAV